MATPPRAPHRLSSLDLSLTSPFSLSVALFVSLSLLRCSSPWVIVAASLLLAVGRHCFYPPPLELALSLWFAPLRCSSSGVIALRCSSASSLQPSQVSDLRSQVSSSLLQALNPLREEEEMENHHQRTENNHKERQRNKTKRKIVQMDSKTKTESKDEEEEEMEKTSPKKGKQPQRVVEKQSKKKGRLFRRIQKTKLNPKMSKIEK
ncbi:uncharacterized protein [Arachis hypogaea]|uniref:uncharacterized protein n=1 Tax=Arachis hypogaea TaxID=3818 RepID=UPI003B2260E2